MGQGWVLHSPDWAKVGHFLPPCWSGVMTERVRVLNPPPHGSEQVLDQASQPDTTQSMAHVISTHLAVLTTAGHAPPPCTARVITERFLVLVAPSPHVLVQGA